MGFPWILEAPPEKSHAPALQVPPLVLGALACDPAGISSRSKELTYRLLLPPYDPMDRLLSSFFEYYRYQVRLRLCTRKALYVLREKNISMESGFAS